MKLTQKQNQIIVGTVLGDGYLQKTGAMNARLRLEHGYNQKDYLLWKTEQFPKLFQGKPKYLERRHPKTKKVYKYFHHQSNAIPALGKWRRVFYNQEGKKQIPIELDKYLTSPLSLAVWYMDDGYFYQRDKNSYIYLGKVSFKEAEIAEMTLLKNFGIKTKIYDKKEKGLALFFSVKETKSLHNLIREHVIPLFNYKLLLDNN